MSYFKAASLSRALIQTVVVASFLFGAGASAQTKKPETKISSPNMEALAQTVSSVMKMYVDKIPPDELAKMMIDGVLSKLDVHTAYMDPEDFKRFNEDMSGSYAGIGILAATPTPPLKGIQVEEVFPNGPADKVGLREGDVLVSSDGHPLTGTLDENIKLVKGPSGSGVLLGILRDGKELKIQTPRRAMEPPTVFGSFCECDGSKILFVRLTGFHETTPSELSSILESNLPKNPKSVIMDLRDNPGGSLQASVDVAGLFLPDNKTVVSIRERGTPEKFMGTRMEGDLRSGLREALNGALNGAFVGALDAPSRKQLMGKYPQLSNSKALPLYVMVNSSSASASEIVAAALQEHGRALIVGERTFGKGSVQTVLPLANDGALKITIARYHTPSGRSIQALGVDPDVPVGDARAWRIEAIERAKVRYSNKAPKEMLREADLPRHLGPTYVSAKESAAKDEDEMVNERKDLQFKKSEPNERRFSYAPFRHDGKPDAVTAKALELARSGTRPKPAVSQMKHAERIKG